MNNPTAGAVLQTVPQQNSTKENDKKQAMAIHDNSKRSTDTWASARATKHVSPDVNALSLAEC